MTDEELSTDVVRLTRAKEHDCVHVLAFDPTSEVPLCPTGDHDPGICLGEDPKPGQGHALRCPAYAVCRRRWAPYINDYCPGCPRRKETNRD